MRFPKLPGNNFWVTNRSSKSFALNFIFKCIKIRAGREGKMIQLCSLFNRNLSVASVGMLYISNLLLQIFLQNPSEVYLQVSPISEKLTENDKNII